MMRFFNRLKVIVDHPVTHLLVGLALMTTGCMQIYDDLVGDSQQFRVGVHHGIVLLGVIKRCQPCRTSLTASKGG